MTEKNLAGSYIVSSLTGVLGRVSAKLSETEHIVELYNDNGTSESVVLPTAELESNYVITAATDPEPPQFNEPAEDTMSMSEAGRWFYNYFSTINKEYLEALKKHNPRELRNIAKLHSKKTRQARKDMIAQLSKTEWRQVVDKLSMEMLTLQQGASASFIKSLSGQPPSANFTTVMQGLLDAYSGKDAIEGYLNQYNMALAKSQSDIGFAINYKTKRMKTDVAPYKDTAVQKLTLETDALDSYAKWLNTASNVLDDESIPAAEKHLAFMCDTIDNWLSANEGALTENRQPFIDDATRDAILDAQGMEKLTAFLSATDKRSFLSSQSAMIELGETLRMAEAFLQSAAKGRRSKNPISDFTKSLGTTIYENAAANWERPQAAKLRDLASDLGGDPADYLGRLSDFITTRYHEQKDHTARLEAEYATLEEREGRPRQSTPRINFPVLTGRQLQDMSIGLWLQTDFVESLFKLVEKETGVKRDDIRWGLREDLPEAVAVQWEVLRHQDPSNVDFTPVPSAAVPDTATAWGPADPKQLADKGYVYVEPEGGKYILKAYPPTIKKTDTGREYRDAVLDRFESSEEAMTALQTYTTEHHESFVSAPGESAKEFSKTEIVDHKRYRVVKPNIQSLVKSRYLDTAQANKVRNALKFGQNPELDELLGMASRVVALGGHRWHLKSLNQKLANAGDLAQFFTDIFYTGEFIKGSSAPRQPGLPKYQDTATDYQYQMKIPGQDRPDTPLTIRKYKTNLSDLAIADYDKPDFSGYFREVYDMVVRALVSHNYAEAKDLINSIPEQYEALVEKSSEVVAKQNLSEIIPIPPIEYKEVAHDIVRGDSAFNVTRDHMQELVNTLAQTFTPKKTVTNLNVGATNMANLNEMNSLKQGQPVMLAGTSAVHVVVSRDESDPFTYFVIPESSINTHDRVDLISAHINNITPLKVYKIDVGDVLEVNSSVAKVVDASAKEIGIVSLSFRGSPEAVPFSLEDTDVPREIKAPYKLIQCSRDGGYITEDDEINCPFHDAAGHFAHSVSHYRPRTVTASKVETVDPELEKKFRHEYEVEKLTAALKAISFEQAVPTPETLPVEQEQDFDGELEIGATVKKFASTATGTVLGRKQACWVVAWESGKHETCWPQELILVKE
jgi:hypothetical protein